MRERGLSVLLAGKDHMQISFSFENKTFWKRFFVYSIFMIAAQLKGVLRGLKRPWVIFHSCKIQLVAG